MAKMTTAKKAKGSVVTPARKSAKRKSTTTAKGAGVKARKPSVKASTKRHADKVAEVRGSAISARHKLPYLCATLDEALAKADAMRDSLTTAGLHTAGESVCPKRESAQARREWCAKNGAPLVNIAEILHANKEGESVTKRTENVLRSRIQRRGKYAHNNPNYYYSVRATAFDGESQSLAYLVRL